MQDLLHDTVPTLTLVWSHKFDGKEELFKIPVNSHNSRRGTCLFYWHITVFSFKNSRLYLLLIKPGLLQCWKVFSSKKHSESFGGVEMTKGVYRGSRNDKSSVQFDFKNWQLFADNYVFKQKPPPGEVKKYLYPKGCNSLCFLVYTS